MMQKHTNNVWFASMSTKRVNPGGVGVIYPPPPPCFDMGGITCLLSPPGAPNSAKFRGDCRGPSKIR